MAKKHNTYKTPMMADCLSKYFAQTIVINPTMDSVAKEFGIELEDNDDFETNKANGCIISTKEMGDTFYFKAEWDNNDKEAAIQEILAILEMKVGPRSPKNEIYYKVNEFCNQFDLNSSFDFLASKIRKEFAGTPNLEEIIYTVLD